jgi:hypothetical protein
MFLTWFLWVILVLIPQSTGQSTLPSQFSISLRSYPRYYRTTNIPLAYSSSVSQTTKSLTRMISFYATFVVYLKMISHLLSLIQHRSVIMDNLKFLRTSWGFPHLFYKGKWFFSEVKHFCNFFYFFFNLDNLLNLNFTTFFTYSLLMWYFK